MHRNCRREIMCSTQVVFISTRETLQKENFIFTNFEKYFKSKSTCSSPASRNPEILQWTYTHCTVILAGLRKKDWRLYLDSTPHDGFEKHILYNVHLDAQYTEYFILFSQVEPDSRPEFTYLCRFCNYTFNITEHRIPSCKNGIGCRNEIEKIVHQLTQDGRHIAPRFPVESHYDEIEDNPSFLFTSSSLEEMSWVKNLTIRSYWKNSTLLPFTKIIQAILFEPVDASTATNLIKANRTYGEFMRIIFNNRHLIYYKKIGKLRVDYSTLYLTGTTSFNFVTCHGYEAVSPVKAYLQAFDVETWSLILIAILVTLIILGLTVSFLNQVKRVFFISIPLQKISSICFYVSSTILENGSKTYVPILNRRAINFINIIFCSLSVICIVLGNSYKGVFTRDIILPTPSKIPVELIQELHNFTLLVLPITKSMMEVHKKFLYQTLEERKRTGETGGLGLSAFSKQILSISLNENIEKAERTVFNNIYESINVYPNKYESRLALKSCSKNAFVGTKEELEEFMSFPESATTFAYGKDNFLTSYNYWQMPALVGRYFHRRMASLINSGIHQMWENIYFKKFQTINVPSAKATDHHQNQKQGLRGKLAALFKFVIIGLTILIGIFQLEIIVGHLEQKIFQKKYLYPHVP